MADQTQSRLLSLPLEIRREIILHVLSPVPNLHLYLEDGRPRVSPCLGANLGEERFRERTVPREPGAPFADRQGEWARRMNSPWANHWMCEEVRDGKQFPDHPVKGEGGHTFALLVCKQM
ncbi:hypothetical protein IMZ48_30100 [Candidatus Bathyarchaeota archaeon]|nr:hypothetical protein [Candidatus Bathyarchaeota archaeon]